MIVQQEEKQEIRTNKTSDNIEGITYLFNAPITEALDVEGAAMGNTIFFRHGYSEHIARHERYHLWQNSKGQIKTTGWYKNYAICNDNALESEAEAYANNKPDIEEPDFSEPLLLKNKETLICQLFIGNLSSYIGINASEKSKIAGGLQPSKEGYTEISEEDCAGIVDEYFTYVTQQGQLDASEAEVDFKTWAGQAIAKLINKQVSVGRKENLSLITSPENPDESYEVSYFFRSSVELFKYLELKRKRTISEAGKANQIKVSMINVGAGDSILVQAPECNVLIDLGDNIEKIFDFLSMKKDQTQQGNERGILLSEGKTMIVISHQHSDHMGFRNIVGLRAFLTQLPKEVQDLSVLAGQSTYNLFKNNTEIMNRIKEFLDSAGLNIVELALNETQPVSVKQSQANSDSLVLTMTTSKEIVIFAGDLTITKLKKRLNTIFESYGQTEERPKIILKVPHHGSKENMNIKILQMLTDFGSEVSLFISSGNDYSHPSFRAFRNGTEAYPNGTELQMQDRNKKNKFHVSIEYTKNINDKTGAVIYKTDKVGHYSEYTKELGEKVMPSDTSSMDDIDEIRPMPTMTSPFSVNYKSDDNQVSAPENINKYTGLPDIDPYKVMENMKIFNDTLCGFMETNDADKIDYLVIRQTENKDMFNDWFRWLNVKDTLFIVKFFVATGNGEQLKEKLGECLENSTWEEGLNYLGALELPEISELNISTVMFLLEINPQKYKDILFNNLAYGMMLLNMVQNIDLIHILGDFLWICKDYDLVRILLLARIELCGLLGDYLGEVEIDLSGAGWGGWSKLCTHFAENGYDMGIEKIESVGGERCMFFSFGTERQCKFYFMVKSSVNEDDVVNDSYGMKVSKIITFIHLFDARIRQHIVSQQCFESIIKEINNSIFIPDLNKLADWNTQAIKEEIIDTEIAGSYIERFNNEKKAFHFFSWPGDGIREFVKTIDGQFIQFNELNKYFRETAMYLLSFGNIWADLDLEIIKTFIRPYLEGLSLIMQALNISDESINEISNIINEMKDKLDEMEAQFNELEVQFFEMMDSPITLNDLYSIKADFIKSKNIIKENRNECINSIAEYFQDQEELYGLLIKIINFY